MEQSKKQECIELIKMIYRHHAAGGRLHIILDDGNTDDGSVDFCVRYIAEEQAKDEDIRTVWFHCVEMAVVMLLNCMTEDERDEVIEQAWKEMRYEASVIDLSKAISKRLKIDKDAKVDVRETLGTLTEGADNGTDTQE